jgi:hypothetical protein
MSARVDSFVHLARIARVERAEEVEEVAFDEDILLKLKFYLI